MNKEFVPYEPSLDLKELGFDEPCFGYYYTLNGKDWKFADDTQYNLLDELYNIGSMFTISAPLYQQAFRFFREKHNLEYQIMKSGNGNYYVTIYKNTQEYLDSIVGLTHACLDEVVDCYSYEEAELECLRKLIEIVKNNE